MNLTKPQIVTSGGLTLWPITNNNIIYFMKRILIMFNVISISFFLSLFFLFLFLVSFLVFFFIAQQDGSIEFEEFIRALSITSRGNLDEKLHCKFFSKKLLIMEKTLKSQTFYRVLCNALLFVYICYVIF